jgi:hypothetical protein
MARLKSLKALVAEHRAGEISFEEFKTKLKRLNCGESAHRSATALDRERDANPGTSQI